MQIIVNATQPYPPGLHTVVGHIWYQVTQMISRYQSPAEHLGVRFDFQVTLTSQVERLPSKTTRKLAAFRGISYILDLNQQNKSPAHIWNTLPWDFIFVC